MTGLVIYLAASVVVTSFLAATIVGGRAKRSHLPQDAFGPYRTSGNEQSRATDNPQATAQGLKSSREGRFRP
jgi:hypothetical protein